MTIIAQMLLHQGCQQTDCAKILGISPSAVNQRFRRMKEEVVVPFVREFYPDGIPVNEPTDDPNDIRFRFKDSYDCCNPTTPDPIISLKPDQVLVYGSDFQGIPIGPQGCQAWPFLSAQPSLGPNGNTYSIASFGSKERLYVEITIFLKYAEEHEDTLFLVTDLDCRLAGYSIEWLANLLSPALGCENISLPEPIIKML